MSLAVRAKERMEAGRPKEGTEKFPEDKKGEAREKAATAAAVAEKVGGRGAAGIPRPASSATRKILRNAKERKPAP